MSACTFPACIQNSARNTARDKGVRKSSRGGYDALLSPPTAPPWERNPPLASVRPIFFFIGDSFFFGLGE